MYEIFTKILEEKGLKVADVVKGTGIRHGVFTDWKMGRYTPKVDKLEIIADFLGVSLDYLLGKEKEPTNVSPLTIQYAEKFNRLPAEWQNQISDLVEALQEKPQDADKILSMIQTALSFLES